MTAAIAIAAPARAAARRPWSVAVIYGFALVAFFYSSYGLANWVTNLRSAVPSMVFDWERHVPFLAWTIVPYWSINLFYCLSFFVCRTRYELGQHAKRLLVAQILCISVSLAFPLRFTFERPTTSGVFGTMFAALEAFDGPFNQAPSLHLSLAVILLACYSDRLEGIARWLVRAWFLLIGASVLTTYQHHFIDVPSGVWVGAFCCALFPLQAEPKYQEHSSPHPKLSFLYLGGSLLLTAIGVQVGSWALWLLWPAGACLIVSGIYWTGDPTLFRKRRGSLQTEIQLLLAPYTMAAWLNSRWWTRHEPPALETAGGVWFGRLLSRVELEVLGISSVVDVTSELRMRTEGIEYRNIPILDLTAPSFSQLDRWSPPSRDSEPPGPL
jgi:hypothetical protein